MQRGNGQSLMADRPRKSTPWATANAKLNWPDLPAATSAAVPSAPGRSEVQVEFPSKNSDPVSVEPQSNRALERAGLLGAWLEEALRKERAAVAVQLEARHFELVRGLEARLSSSGYTHGESTGEAPWQQVDVIAQSMNTSHATSSRSSARKRHSGSPRPTNEGGSSQELGGARRTAASVKSAPARSASFMQPQQHFTRPRSFKDCVKHPLFEYFFTTAILINVTFMALEMQYNGTDYAFLMANPNATIAPESTWPLTKQLVNISPMVFGYLFTTEVVLKIIGLRLSFVYSWWNWFDLFVVLFWLCDSFLEVDMGVNPMFFRLARLAKVLRMIRLVKFMHSLDALQLLVSSIEASFSILFWSVFILSGVMVMYAFILHYMLEDFMQDANQPLTSREKVYEYFGTFTRAMLSMVEVTLGNWVPICRTLVEGVSEWYSGVFLLYRITVGFGVVKVITGVFMHETFKVASSDDELMIIQKERLIEKHMQKMGTLFVESDTSGDGFLTKSEFRAIMHDRRVKTWLSAMELDVNDVDVDVLFSLLDSPTDSDAAISAEELVRGVARLKGSARSIDMAVLMRTIDEIRRVQSQSSGVSAEELRLLGAEMSRETGGLRAAVNSMQHILKELLLKQGRPGKPERLGIAPRDGRPNTARIHRETTAPHPINQ